MEPPLQRLTTLTAEIQEAVRRVRMQPIGEAWRKLPSIVRGLAQHLGKRIELVTVGADTEIDRQALDLIRDPLIHVVRNCADHGLESPDERRRAGKPETGCISVSACRKADHVLVEIADDGRGLDADRIRHTALQCGLATADELAQIPEVRLNRFIFRAGFPPPMR
jgi:two-component system chemotaxis sensor kinase CheA